MIWRRRGATVLTAVLLAGVVVAYANPVVTLWVPGVYAGGDSDDAALVRPVES